MIKLVNLIVRRHPLKIDLYLCDFVIMMPNLPFIIVILVFFIKLLNFN